MLEIPELVHKWNHTHSILSICVFPNKNLLFAGTQDSKILVVDKKSYDIIKTIQLGNTTSSTIDPLSSISYINTRSSVLCLDKSLDEKYLFSAGADSLVRVWSIDYCKKDHSLQIKEIATVYSITDIGDIFSIKYLDSVQTLVFGCQDASLLYLDNIIDRIHDCTASFNTNVNLNNDINNSHTSNDHPNILQNAESTSNIITPSQNNIDRLPHRRYDKFFNSKGPTSPTSYTPLSVSPDYLSREVSTLNICDTKHYPHAILEIPAENIIRYAHNGFIYSIVGATSIHTGLNQNNDSILELIITSSGDGISSVWKVSKNKKSGKVVIESEQENMNNEETVFSQAIEYPFLYCGLSEGKINIWDLNTGQLVSELKTPDMSDIISISVHDDCVFAINEESINIFYHDQLVHWNPNQGKLLGSEIFICDMANDKNNSILNSYSYLSVGGNDGSLTLWNISSLFQNLQPSLASRFVNKRMKYETNDSSTETNIDTEEMILSLRKLISFKTISQETATECRISLARCAIFLVELLKKLGADDVQLLPVDGHHGPVVLAHFHNQRGREEQNSVKRILWYGHYDVISAGDSEKWDTDPFTLTCENGYMKGRGVSDNKGPLISAIYSVASLYQQNKLKNDIIFLIEGSEEIGSPGFERICSARIFNPKIDWIFLSNSSWVDEEHPCINYGLRGVINAEITITSDKSNGHSGINGGLYQEVTFDLMHIISKLQDDEGRISIPDFEKTMKTPDKKELERFAKVINVANFSKTGCCKKGDYCVNFLIKNWAKPSISVTSLKVNGPGNITVIPNSASAGVSIRLVPGQDVRSVKENLKEFLIREFAQLNSPNHLQIDVVNEAEPWLGDPSNHAYQILEREVTKAWGMEPLFVREGGSIPSIRMLERSFNAPAIQIPCGQSTDNAHLDNENLRIKNWTKMTQILSNVFNNL
ncbi:glutamine amidotransferase subunit DUG2 PWA37_004390 [Arxiozyma heterogenica]|uniref:Peptidase M20 dimerisation domain-containing protein n=1 Tax=Arxiozyma heterogenica TaxID=278026 RepID=A0AAN7WQC6_9SACH|nr:hypothetical protein RI543_003403 [Kazachstania heterogenica]